MVKKVKKNLNKKSEKKIKKIKNSTKLRRIALRAFIFWHFYLNFRKAPAALSIAGWHCGWYH